MIERSQQEHDILALVGMWKLPCIAHERLRQPASCARVALLPSLVDVQRHGINQPDDIPRIRQPHRVGSGAASDIQDLGRRGRQITKKDLLGACPFQLERTLLEPLLLHAGAVVGEDFRKQTRHGSSLSRKPATRDGCSTLLHDHPRLARETDPRFRSARVVGEVPSRLDRPPS
jgi:hypothetical protein